MPRVIADYSNAPITYANLAEAGYQYVEALDKYNIAEMAADYIYAGAEMPAISLPGGLKKIVDASTWNLLRDQVLNFPMFSSWKAFSSADKQHSELNFVQIELDDIAQITSDSCVNVALIIKASGSGAGHAWRFATSALDEIGVNAPIILKTELPTTFKFYSDDHLPEKFQLSREAKQQLFLAGITGAQMVDGQADGLMICPANETTNRTSFGIFQASRLRVTKTEYISCPSCGRTLFDLQETTAKIRVRTEHLKGIKIGIMGCIVNGPGEMADADYGYVGVGPDKISLYRGQEVVHKNVKTDEAVDKLIELITSDGNWVEMK